jgi:hypothetical protein
MAPSCTTRYAMLVPRSCQRVRAVGDGRPPGAAPRRGAGVVLQSRFVFACVGVLNGLPAPVVLVVGGE